VRDAVGGIHARTVTLAVATPPRPEHEIVYVDVRATTMLCDPEGPSEPLQASDAVHEVAFVDDQVSVTGGPGIPASVAELVSVTVGGSPTSTTTSAIPAPMTGLPQMIWKRVVSVSGAVICDPDVGIVGSVAAGGPNPRHSVAFCDDQVSRTVSFGSTDVRSAVRDALGGLHALIVTLAVATPPRPEHDSVYVDVCGTTMLCDPEGPSEPLQASDAVHEVAFVDDQVSVTGGPGIPASVAELVSVTVGAGGLGDDEPPPHAAIASATTTVMAILRNCDRMASPPGRGRIRWTSNTYRLGPDPALRLNPASGDFHRGCWHAVQTHR
jgi:hypothetical protein